MPDESGACEYHYVLVDFYCTAAGGELRAGDDSKRAEWFEMDSLETLLLTPGTHDVIRSCCTRAATHPYVTRP
jgi:ADP-ribose pyrophosphatase YjhB (NUDIX family)